jgi:VanZ family protein
MIGVLWAVALEAVQGFLLWERSAGLEDYVADIVGVLLGMLVFERLVRLSRR